MSNEANIADKPVTYADCLRAEAATHAMWARYWGQKENLENAAFYANLVASYEHMAAEVEAAEQESAA